MKKIMFVCSLILFVIVGMASYTAVYAVENITVAGGEVLPDQQQAEPVESAISSVVQKVEYTLPYPGILPDHPLYFLKRLRDTILERLITDPIRKAEFYVLQSDKRLQMGIMLTDGGKGNLGESTISKAEKYMEQAAVGLSAYKKSGGIVPPYVVERLEKATAKHKEVMTDLLEKVQETEKAGLEGSMTLLKEVIASLGSLK
ncbi:MAG: hypothetical protein UT57_C0026G0004 [Microgenomates group bacterium GW2011_GWC1_39_7]|nr:MAG: hypothetical protein UT57_C0026G0004 [Microgenomates group bacterium GW2011_GWC1_39_7]HCM82552.1 hypothetical protein [Patescibacteria group bacterium]